MDKAVFSPRANIRYNPTQDVNIRFSYAEDSVLHKRLMKICISVMWVESWFPLSAPKD